MSYQTIQPEWATVYNQIRIFEGITGLTALKIEPDATSVRVVWSYPDESWAGADTYDLPLDQVIEKLDKQISHEQKRVELGLPKRDTGQLPALDLIVGDQA